MAVFTLRLLSLLRFLCFLSLVYLGLHSIFARLISRPNSKVLWFFSILTSPLTRPLHMWMAPSSPEPQRRFIALMVYGGLWVLIALAMQAIAYGLRMGY